MLTFTFESQAHSPRYLTMKHSFSYFQIEKVNVYHYDLEVFLIFFRTYFTGITFVLNK